MTFGGGLEIRSFRRNGDKSQWLKKKNREEEALGSRPRRRVS
jgi:hypothetical protein